MNLPNRITTVRLILVPVFILVCLVPAALGMNPQSFTFLGASVTIVDVLAFVIFMTASVTDWFDGHLARSMNLVTTFGKFVDPVADKLLVNSALIILTSWGRISVVALLVMIGRDTIVDAIRFMAASRNEVIAARMLGKCKTATQMTAICLLLLNNPVFSLIHVPMATILIWVAVFFSVISGIEYFMKAKHYILETM